jgi:hypothetical protein
MFVSFVNTRQNQPTAYQLARLGIKRSLSVEMMVQSVYNLKPCELLSYAVLRIWDVFSRIPDPNFSIPDPGSKRFQIPDLHQGM